MTSNIADTTYALPCTLQEQIRLATQHQFIKRRVMRRDGPLPRTIELGSIAKVLDVGAGTLVWTLDVASLPEVRSRISPIVSNSVHFYATDITDKMFPPSHELEALGITTFVHDLTTPFPQDVHGTFDLVHMRLICSALSTEGWRKSLKHIHDVLKPGGVLIVWDCDSVWFPGAIPLTDEYIFDNCREGTSWIHKLNCVGYGYALHNQRIPDPSQRLLSLLNGLSFSVEHLERQILPFGKLCEMAEGPEGELLEHDRQFSIQSLGSVVDAFSRKLLGDGLLEAPWGCKITTDEERKVLLTEIMNGCREEGTYTYSIEVVACKIEYRQS